MKTKIKQRKSVLAVISDTHAGFKYGLCNPDSRVRTTGVDGEITEERINLLEVQKFLWEVYLEIVEKAKELSDGGYPINLIHTGDICHGNKHLEEVVSTRMADQLTIAYDNMIPWLELKNLKRVRLVVGTGAHEFGEGSAPLVVGKAIQESRKDLDFKVVDHLLADVDGVCIDVAHHGPSPSIRSYLYGNNARLALRSMMIADIMAGKIPPDLVIRGHVHTKVDVIDNIVAGGISYESRINILPPLCFMSSYARQKTKSEHSISVGGAVYVIDDGRISKPTWVSRTVDIRTKEVW